MFRQIAPYLKVYRKQFIIGPFFKLVEAVLELTIPIFMSLLIDNGILKNDRGYILRTGGIMFAVIVLGLGSALICQYSASVASQGFGTLLRNRMFEKIAGFSHKEIDKFGTGSLTNRVTVDVNQLQLAVAMVIRLVLRAPFITIGSIIAAMLVDLKLSIVFLITTPIFILLLYLIMKHTFPMYRKVQQRLDGISVRMREYLSGVRVIRAFARTKSETEKFNSDADAYRDASIRVGTLSVLLGPLTMLAMNAAILAILWFSGVRVNVGDLSQGQIIAFINYITQVLMTLIVISNLMVIFTKASASLQRVNEVLETESSVAEGAQTQLGEEPAVQFDHVSFSYFDTDEYQLCDLSFTLPEGGSLGVIGGTGAGKSTLISLIPRFYDCSRGTVRYFGRDVRDYTFDALRGQIGIVPQKNELFSGTVAENILLGCDGAGLADARRAAALALADEFIERLPEGYDTHVERGGTNFSGGQRQRLCIARALARQPKLLILDDSLSALDLRTDYLVRSNLSRLRTTVIIVSQRVSAVKDCDAVLVLDGGHAVGYGTHEALYETCEDYREICRSQQMEPEAGGAPVRA